MSGLLGEKALRPRARTASNKFNHCFVSVPGFRNLRFKIDWDSLIVGRKFRGFALFYFVFEGNFQVKAPGGGGGGLYLEGRFNGEFFELRVWGTYICRLILIFGILRYISIGRRQL